MTANLRYLLLLLAFFTVATSELFAQPQPDGTRGIYFNGSTFVQVPNDASLNLTNNFTIEAWVKLSEIPTGSSAQTIVSKRATSLGGYQFGITDGGKLRLSLPGTAVHITLNNYITDVNRWYHVAVSFSNIINGVRFFVNGAPVEQLDGTGLPGIATDPMRIGADNIGSGSDFFLGQMDGVRISSFVRYIIGFTPPVNPAPDINTVAVYNFDETAGQTVTDQSILANNGWLGTSAAPETSDAIRAIRTINTNDSGTGSLRQAVLDANFDTDINFLDFSIPSPAPWVINLTSNLPSINSRVIVDGTSQLGWSETSLVELNGAGISVADALGFTLAAGSASSEIYGMEIYGFTAGADAAGIRIGASADNCIIGAVDKRNVLRDNLSGINIFGSITGGTIAHNYIGLDNTGSSAQANTNGILISPSLTVSGLQILNNVISANTNNNIRAVSGNNLIIRGNKIGTNAAGTSAAFTQNIGIFLGGTTLNATIGGTAPTETNIIGGHNGQGIQLLGGDNHTVTGNRIGTDLGGTANFGNGTGIEITFSSTGNTIGSAVAGQENIIAFNGFGINITNTGANNNNRITRNSFYCNTGAAIRLEGAGSNINKTAPVITSASTTTVSGTAAANDIIEIFRDNATVCGFANQGRVYVATVTADAGGNWTYTGSFPAGSRITATATDAANNTSSFSTAFALPAPYTTMGSVVWNVNGNWSLDDGVTDCGCNPAGQNNVTVILRHLATVSNAGDIGVNNTIELQDNAELFLQVEPTNQIAEIRTSGAITSVANLRFDYVPVSNNVVALNNLDNTNPLVTVIFGGGDGAIPARLGTELTPKPYPSVVILSGNKTMQFPAGVGNYFINGNFFLSGGASLSFDAATAGNTLEINGSLATVTGGATLNANDTEVKLIINYTLRNSGGTVNGSVAGLEFSNISTANYQHDTNGGNIPLANWGLNSFCNVTGVTNVMPGGWAGQTFGNLIWNCGNQSTYLAFNADFEVAGTFSVITTRNPSFPLGLSVASTGSYTMKVKNFEMTAPINDANFYPYGGVNPADVGTLEITGDCSITGGGTGVLSNIGTSRLLFTGNTNSLLSFNPGLTFNGDARWVFEVDKSGGATVATASDVSVTVSGFGTPASFLRLTNGIFNIDNNHSVNVSNIEGSVGILQMSTNSRLFLEQHNPSFSNTFNGTVSLDPTSRIFYRSANEQRIFVPSSGNYANITLDGENNSTPVSKNIDGNIQAASVDIINNANLNFEASTDVLVRINGALTNTLGQSTITHNMAGYNHTLELRGTVNQADNFVVTGAGNSSHVIYGRTDDQQVFASPNYVELTIDGGGTKTLQGTSEVAYKLNLTNGKLQLGTFDLTYNGTPANLSASSAGWVATNGSGRFVQGAAGSNLLFPVGSDVAYQPVRLATAVAGSSARFGNSTPGLPVGSVGSWFIDNLTTDTDVLIENPQGGSIIWNLSEIGRYTTAWNTLTTAYPSTNVYQAFLPSTGTVQELAVIASTPVIPTQPIGNRGLYFDGADDYISAAPIVLSNMTMSAWIKPAAWGGGIVSTLGENGSGNNGFALEVATDGQVVFSFGEDGNRDWIFSGLTNVVPVNQWSHVAGTYEAATNTMRLFVNGVEVANGLSFRTAGTRIVSIGSVFTWGWRFNGQIDEVRIFDTALNTPQIQVNMGSAAVNGAAAFWRFEEGTGSTTADASPNSNTASLPAAPENPLWALRVINTDAAGAGSFRQVITEANTLAGRNYIDFSIPDTDPNYSTGVWTIQSSVGVPDNVLDGSIIDGYSAFGSAPATTGTPATIVIQLQQPTAGNTLQLAGTQPVTVRGLSIAQSVSNGLAALWLSGTAGHIVQGNHIGVNAAGNVPFPAATSGSLVIQSSANNIVGGIAPAARNIISGADNYGIRIDGFTPSANNQILGNYIGVAADGTTPLPNGNSGIFINSAATNNLIGNGAPTGRNIIANNIGWGVEITGVSVNNTVSNNHIYANVAGGILVQAGSNNDKAAPVLTTFSPTQLSGTCVAGDIVEVFSDSPQTGTTNQGRQFLGQATVVGTTWTLNGTFTAGTRYTATATDATGSTSPFSAALPFDFTTAQSGNWNDPATWAGGNVPPAGSNITIVNSHTVTADVNVNINSLIIEPNAALNMSNFALTIPAVSLGGTLDLGTGAHTLSAVTDNGGAGQLIANDNATAAVIGSLTGDFFDVAGNTVVFAGSGSYTLPIRNYPTLKVTGTGIRTVPTGSPIVVSGHIVNNASGAELNINAEVTLPITGLLPHLIQGTSGNTLRFNNSLTALGDVQVTGNANCEVNGVLTVTGGLFENQNPLFSIGTGGDITGTGTFRNLATVLYQSANTPSVSTLNVSTVPNRFIYANGTAAVAAVNYDVLAIRGNRLSNAGIISANAIELDNAATATEWTLNNGSTVVINGNLTLDNANGAILDLGTGNATVVVNGNLLGAAANSEIRSFPGTGNAHLLELKGAINTVALYDASGDATVRYNGANQQVFGSFDYMFVEITGGGVKSLQDEASINGQLRLLNGRLQLNNHNLTLANPIVADQLTGIFANSWIQTNGSGRLIRQGAGANVVFPVGDATAARPVTVATTATGNTEVAFTNTISPTVTAANIAAGMWSINSPAIATNLTFAGVGGTANSTSEIYSSNSPWVLVPTLPARPPYTTASPVTFSGTSQNFTVFSNACITPVISAVQDESAFLCSPTLGRVTIRLQEASVTTGALYDIDLNGDGIWERTNVLPLNTSVLLADNLAAGTVINNPRVRVAGSSCVSAPFPFNLTISSKKPVILAAEITRPISCATSDGKLLLRIRNGVVNGFYHVDLNNDGINEFSNLRLRSDSTISVEGIAEKTPLPAVKVTYAISSCASEALPLSQVMPDAIRPAVNLAVTGETEADPDEIIAIRVQDIQAGVSYRLMRDTVQIGQPQSGTAGATLTFNTEPLLRNSVYHILAKKIDSGCEVELEQKISIRVYHEVTDSLTLVALYNSANGANWQPVWNLRTPVRTWHGVSVRKGRVVSLGLNGKGLAGIINPVLQLPRLNTLHVANNRLEFDAFENVLPALTNRGMALVFSPQAPVNEELTITEFETKTVTLRTTARGTRNTYQWFKDGRPLTGSTASELTLRNLNIRDTGVYHCEVRNPEAPGLVIQRRRITLNVLQYMRSQTDSLVLVELYRTLGGDNWIQRFDFRNPVATWPGIQTTNGRVTGINLSNNNLTGEIPDIFIELRGLGILDDLEYLNLSNNKITGRIPESLTNHRKLTYLDLSFNLLEGDIPAYIGAFAELRTLWLSGNRFTSLPREIGQLSKLTNLLLDGNLLAQIPDEIGQLRNLQILRMSGNRLRTVPSSVSGTFGSLKILGLADNNIESLPAVFESLPDGLEQLLLHNNRLSVVPLNTADRPRLQLLTIYGNRMDFGLIEPLMLRFRDRRSAAEVLYAPQAPIGTAGELTVQNGQAFTLTIRTGGTANRYRWFKDNNPVDNDLNIADYTIARSQADDTGSYRVQVTNPNAPDLTLVSLPVQVQITCATAATFTIRAQGATELCGNEPFTTVLQVTGMENAAEIRWLRNGSLLAGVQGRNFTPQTAGRYRAMVRTEGANCFAVSSNEIEIQISENISTALTVAQGGRLFVQVAGNPAVQRYEWFRNGQLIASTISREFTAEQAGNYSVSLITSNGCRFTSAVVAVDNTIVGIEEWPTVVPLRLYPNPARDQLQIQSSLLKIEDCKVFNALGQQLSVRAEKQLPHEWLLDIGGLVPGAYLLRCRTQQGDIWLKWIKE
ncbi:LamG-like jellyroll fold domain-containing protein [Rhodoflexus caldus]|uniref:LamG-like jellyroll fold domain-containing protein n=1 Tax=Rhodoflexus caldus TaxID=2891236 RepID=UPI002029ECCE|nr:LamG-like jellyroll fold domain-containing protein [Rhodoflexus caldus]